MKTIEYRFGLDEIYTLPADEAGKQAAERIKERLKSLCTDFREAIIESGYTFAMVADRSDQTASALAKSLTNSFSMSVLKLNKVCDIVFPNLTLDEIIYGEKLPMRLPNIDRLFLKTYSYIYFQNKSESSRLDEIFQTMIKKGKRETSDACTRYFGVREDWWMSDPILPEYRTIPQTTNLTSFSMWKVEASKLRVQTLLRASVFCKMSLDFLCRDDYSVCNLYYEENGKRVSLTSAERKLLSNFCVLKYSEKARIIGEMMSCIDYSN